jgi:hypothetical protein
MSDLQVTLSPVEQEFLRQMLQSALGETRVEARRTRTVEYRDAVHSEESLIQGLLSKLKQAD